MERYNIKNVEEKWQNIWSSKNSDSVILDKNNSNIYSHWIGNSLRKELDKIPIALEIMEII